MTRVPSERRLPLLVATVVVVAFLVFVVSWERWPLTSLLPSGPGLVFWTILTLVVSAFPVVAPRGSVVSVSIAPILASAILGGPLRRRSWALSAFWSCGRSEGKSRGTEPYTTIAPSSSRVCWLESPT